MSSRLSKQWIEHCYDADVCHVCGKTVLYGPESEGIYTITGAHYSCEFPNGRTQSQTLRELASEFDQLTTRSDNMPTAKEPALARANGGFLLHWVVPHTGRSLCGHQPARNASRMRQRGRWLYLKETFNSEGSRFCKRCESERSVAVVDPTEQESISDLRVERAHG